MSQGNRIVLTPDRGIPVEGIINTGETPKPGQIVQIDPTQSRVGGRWVFKLYNRDADGNNPAGPNIVLREDILQGKTTSDAYAAGDIAFGFIPFSGCELNLLLLNISGTADDHTAGEILMVDDGTGKLIATTGSPEQEVAMLLETVTDPTADTLSWCIWS